MPPPPAPAAPSAVATTPAADDTLAPAGIPSSSDIQPPPTCIPPAALCYVCAADAAIEARRPAARHGQAVAVGASGFTGWTKGMQRTSDAKALKAMYKSERPQQVLFIGNTVGGAGSRGGPSGYGELATLEH
jgi:hypothetical protein